MDLELRVTRKEIGWRFIVKLAWIVSSLSVMLIGLGACIPGEGPCTEAGYTMEGFMFFLSFPSSIVFFLLAPVFYGWDSVRYPGAYFLLWLGAFVVGYLQW